MIELLYLIFLVLVSLALGRRILKAIGVNFQNNLEDFVFSYPLGLALLAYITFFFGIVGLLYKFAIILVLLVLFIILIKDIKDIVLILFNFAQKININELIKKRKHFDFFKILFILLLFFFLINLILSFVPPWHFDVLAYHLAIQKLYINSHQITYIPYIFYSNLPSLVDTIYLIGLLLYNGILSNLLAYS